MIKLTREDKKGLNSLVFFQGALFCFDIFIEGFYEGHWFCFHFTSSSVFLLLLAHKPFLVDLSIAERLKVYYSLRFRSLPVLSNTEC